MSALARNQASIFTTEPETALGIHSCKCYLFSIRCNCPLLPAFFVSCLLPSSLLYPSVKPQPRIAAGPSLLPVRYWLHACSKCSAAANSPAKGKSAASLTPQQHTHPHLAPGTGEFERDGARPNPEVDYKPKLHLTRPLYRHSGVIPVVVVSQASIDGQVSTRASFSNTSTTYGGACLSCTPSHLTNPSGNHCCTNEVVWSGRHLSRPVQAPRSHILCPWSYNLNYLEPTTFTSGLLFHGYRPYPLPAPLNSLDLRTSRFGFRKPFPPCAFIPFPHPLCHQIPNFYLHAIAVFLSEPSQHSRSAQFCRAIRPYSRDTNHRTTSSITICFPASPIDCLRSQVCAAPEPPATATPAPGRSRCRVSSTLPAISPKFRAPLLAIRNNLRSLEASRVTSIATPCRTSHHPPFSSPYIDKETIAPSYWTFVFI